MELYPFILLGLFSVLGGVWAGDTCYIDKSNEFEYCDKGCCGKANENNRRCCTDTDILVWIIVGSVIGGIILISCIMAVVIYFCCIRGKSRQGRVINPQPNTQVTTLIYQTPGQHQNSPYPIYGPGTVVNPPPYMGPPPAYAQGQPNQQQTGQNNPAAPWPQQQQYPPPPMSQSTSTNQYGVQQVPPPPKY